MGAFSQHVLPCFRAAVAAMVLFGPLGANGCRQVLDIHERKEAAGSAIGVCGGFEHATAACAECMDRECCNDLEQCEASPSCQSYVSCVLGCAGADAECRSLCHFADGAGFVTPGTIAHRALFGCRAARCSAACGISCGGTVYATAACDTCMRDGCCAEDRACKENPECAALACDCFQGDVSCESACKDGSTAASLYQAWVGCRANVCGGVCSEPGWGCLGLPLSWLRPKTFDNVSLELKLIDFLTFEPWTDLTLRACLDTDPTCDEPIDQRTSDASGTVVFSLPLAIDGFAGYLEIVSDPTAALPAYPGILHLTPPPIVEDTYRVLRWPSAGAVNALAALMSIELDPTRGHVAINPSDCHARLAQGVRLDLLPDDPDAIPFSFIEQTPNRGISETYLPLALAGFANVKPGASLMSGSVASSGKHVGRSPLLVRPQTLTFSAVQPGP